ncbi:MAG: hypothetical protein LPK19_08510, partial [Hymenobacteraceae bacterium]|nr:hypothetical protein [Hymenobacteraceae bacterium]MDX5396257.1 hypothetical protein [Hymenobacteraceae bacterium]MDX5512320.1 hypothetical protein [Hymenobacteraceae bacterium]
MKKSALLAMACAVMLPLMVRCQQPNAKKNKPETASVAPVNTQTPDHYPARPGFNVDSSDAKAIEIADRVVKNMGGYKAWDNSRYVAWSYYGQYQIWDKHTNFFRHEQNGQVVLMNLLEPEGKAYKNGAPVVLEEDLKGILQRTYIFWANNTYWLALPYKLKDSGVTLKYKGEGETATGKPADILELTFANVGIT